MNAFPLTLCVNKAELFSSFRALRINNSLTRYFIVWIFLKYSSVKRRENVLQLSVFYTALTIYPLVNLLNHMFRKMYWLLIDIPSALYNNYVLFLLCAEDLESENGIPSITLSKTFFKSNQKGSKNALIIFALWNILLILYLQKKKCLLNWKKILSPDTVLPLTDSLRQIQQTQNLHDIFLSRPNFDKAIANELWDLKYLRRFFSLPDILSPKLKLKY